MGSVQFEQLACCGPQGCYSNTELPGIHVGGVKNWECFQNVLSVPQFPWGQIHFMLSWGEARAMNLRRQSISYQKASCTFC